MTTSRLAATALTAVLTIACSDDPPSNQEPPPGSSACGTTYCTATEVCVYGHADGFPHGCAPPCYGPTDCAGTAECCDYSTFHYDSNLGRLRPAGRCVTTYPGAQCFYACDGGVCIRR